MISAAWPSLSFSAFQVAVIAAERAGLRYALALPGIRVPAANGGAHHARCLRLLALHGLADAAMEDEA